MIDWISLTPRFEDSLMCGYNQIDGTHIYDNFGQEYRFVPFNDYHQLLEENTKLKANAITLGNEIARQSERAMNAEHRADCWKKN